MRKLAEREARNAALAKPRRVEGGFALRYVGYSKRPIACEAKPTGDRRVPYVGRIVYEEIEYERRGPSAEAARRAPTRELARTEVTELFRYENGRWIY